MQTLARVNRTFRGKEDGLLVAYAPLADDLQKALSEYTHDDQKHKPIGRNIDEAAALTDSLVATIRGLLTGYDWKSTLNAGGPHAFVKAAHAMVNYLRNPATAGNQVAERDETLRSSIKRLLVKHGYPPDKQLAAIKLVLEQMESIAPRYAADRT